MLDWEYIRARLQRGMRESPGGRCTVKILFNNGQRLTALVTSDCPPSKWMMPELVLLVEVRGGAREEHHVDISEVADLAVVL